MKSDCGSLPAPELVNGPPTENSIGWVMVEEPLGTTLRSSETTPLLIV